MKKKLFISVLPLLCLVTGCQGNSPIKDDTKYYAFFMNNYPRAIETSPSGFDEKVDNTLFLRKEISAGVPFTKPETDPVRDNYEFKGWYKEKAGTTLWDFEKDSATSSVFIYAKWSQTGSDSFIEPEYVPQEKIITDANYRVTGILNIPVKNNKVELTAGAINRLTEHKNDIKFAINYERRENVTLDVATFNPKQDAMSIHLEVSSGEKFDISVSDITASLSVQDASKYYEDKAQKYETLGSKIENYHIALAGSSSMENWSTSTLDMSPIVTFNHGIGGTTVQQWSEKLLQRLVLPYSPKAVVYYVGVNNIINGDHESGEETGSHLVELFNKTHQYLPDTKIFYVMINRLPGFANKQRDFDAANNAAIEYGKAHNYLSCIDAGKGLLKEDGTPNAAYFLTDGLHMSKYGYVIWGQAVKEAIIEWLNEKQ